MALAVYTLLWREIVRFYRQRNRVVGALLQPLLFWLLIGSGLNSSFRSPGSDASYTEYFYPGILLMIVMFTAIFSTITIIEDRRDGFLQGVQVAPVSATSIVLGKVLGGTILGLVQAIVFLLLLLTPLIDLQLSFAGMLLAVGWLFVLGFALTTVGTAMAWPLRSSQEYHALMSVLLLPLWIFSGAAFPVNGAPLWLYWLMQVNPLTHGLAILRWCFYIGAESALAPVPLLVSALYFVGFTLVAFVVAQYMVRRPSTA